MQTKRCPRCGETKPVTAFGRNKAKRDGCQTACRECKAATHRAYYEAHREEWIANANAKIRAKVERVRAYLAEHPCVDCGESDPLVLEFDHVAGAKFMEVTKMAWQGFAWDRIDAEIAKCEVRCCNCHRRATYRRLQT